MFCKYFSRSASFLSLFISLELFQQLFSTTLLAELHSDAVEVYHKQLNAALKERKCYFHLVPNTSYLMSSLKAPAIFSRAYQVTFLRTFNFWYWHIALCITAILKIYYRVTKFRKCVMCSPSSCAKTRIFSEKHNAENTSRIKNYFYGQ